MTTLTPRFSTLFKTALAIGLLAHPAFHAMAEEGQKSRWTGGSPGFWDEESNWSSGVPVADASAGEFLDFEKGSKVTLRSDGSANFLQFTMQKSGADSDLTIGAQNGAVLELACQRMDPGFSSVILCSNRGSSGKVRIFIDAETHIRKPLPSSKAIPTISSTRDFTLSFRGSLIMESAVNLGGTEGSRVEILGDLTHNGLRLGSAGVVTIEGKGKTASSRGGVTFAGDTIILGRPQAIAGRAYKMDGGTLRLAADGTISDPSDVSVVGMETLETGGYGAAFGALSITDSGSLRIVLDKNSTVTFADSSSAEWTPSAKLIIEKHVPGKTSVSFGTNARGLTDAQLAGVTVNGKPAVLDSRGVLQTK
jgi:hypothetical protein